MPAKPPGELTGDEVKILGHASKLLAVLHKWTDHLPPQNEQEYWNVKFGKDVVCLNDLLNSHSKLMTI